MTTNTPAAAPDGPAAPEPARTTFSIPFMRLLDDMAKLAQLKIAEKQQEQSE